MIIVIRGTNGSGKSHAVRAILKLGTIERTFQDGSTLIRLHRVKRPVLVIGPYIAGRSMGGCDCIRQPRRIYRWINRALFAEWHVVLEGVVLATRPYFQMFNEGIDVRYAYFDPPMSTNLERIAMRQAKKGHVSPVNHETMEHKQTQAHLMYIEAKRLDLKTKRFWKSPVNATPWILGQLRTP